MLNDLAGGEDQGRRIEPYELLLDAEMERLQADMAELTLKVERIESKLVVMKWMMWVIGVGVLISPRWSAADGCPAPLLSLGFGGMGPLPIGHLAG